MPRALGLRSAHWPAQSELHTITGTSSKVVPESRHSPSGKFSITPSHLCPQCTLSDPRPPPGSWAWPRPAPLTLRWPGRCPSDRTSGTRCQCLTAPPVHPNPFFPLPSEETAPSRVQSLAGPLRPPQPTSARLSPTLFSLLLQPAGPRPADAPSRPHRGRGTSFRLSPSLHRGPTRPHAVSTDPGPLKAGVHLCHCPQGPRPAVTHS